MTSYLPDVNVWLAIAIDEHAHHVRARSWLETVRLPDRISFCRATQQALLRLMSSPAVHRSYTHGAASNSEAWDAFDAMSADSRTELVVAEPTGLQTTWRTYSTRPSSSPNLWMDAYLAAFASAGGYRFVTFDQAFRQFDGLDLLLLE